MLTNPKVDAYIARSQKWPGVMNELRPLLLNSGLIEDIKWGKPCFSHEGRNIVIFQEMNQFLALMFFKGALMSDPEAVLVEQGPNSRSAKRMEFTSTAQVVALATTITSYVAEAIDVADAGLEPEPAPQLVLVSELQQRLDADAALGDAFKSLTPGRQREYNLHFSEAKQSATRCRASR